MKHQRITIGNAEIEDALEPFLRGYKTSRERSAAIETALTSPAGRFWRQELGKWTVRMVPVELLVPEEYRQWRPLVRDAMQFVVSRLSPARLAPKVVEQIELSPDTPPEERLLRFIAKVPGLQKIGQVLARNRKLDPRVRRALAELENGISDAHIDEIRAIILEGLGEQLEAHKVEIDTEIFAEASVSAIVRFTWRNPESKRREQGVFKVLKPYIRSCYAEDMKILQQLAGYLARKHRAGSVRLAGLAETLTEIRLLLECEVNFRGEQTTLESALRVYRSVPGVRVPRLIRPLSTDHITALTHENGVKVTEAFGRPGTERVRVAERLAEALIAVPALAREKDAIFHADPHAGNVLYDKRRGDLVILDWALTGRLTRAQRKNVLMLVLMMLLRDVDGVCSVIERLRQHHGSENEPARTIREHVGRFLDALPLFEVPPAMAAMRLLDEIAMEGVRFPAALLMFRKASFTLDGVLEDVAGTSIRMEKAITRYAVEHWAATGAALVFMLSPADWASLDWSALTFASRVGARLVLRPWTWVPQLLEQRAAGQAQ